MKGKLTPTERAIIAQLTECTGVAMCDSGGIYGRHWERNQAKVAKSGVRKFVDEPATVLDFSHGSIDVTHNVFHFLNERLEYDADMTRKLKAFARRKQYENDAWLTIMQEFAKEHGVDRDSISMGNTYMREELLSQILQYCSWYDRNNHTGFIALQVHGGCDARDGYTAPTVYRGDYRALSNNLRAAIHCPLCRAMWESDEGYYWRPVEDMIDLTFLDEKDTGLTLPLDRQAYPLLNLAYHGKQEAYKPVELDTEEFPAMPDRTHGNFYINSKGKGLCPYCLTGILEAGCW